MHKLLAVAAAIALALTSAGFTTHIVKDRPGGELIEHIAEFAGWEKHHDRVQITGECYSACTMLLGIVDNDHICAKPDGEFGFHSAMLLHRLSPIIFTATYSEDGTRVLWFFYDHNVREALAKAGWSEPSEHPEMIKIKATDIVAPCKENKS